MPPNVPPTYPPSQPDPTPTPAPSSPTSTPPIQPSSPPESAFECNVCFDVPSDPVVTPCGHLYCWSCLYHWMQLHADSPQCPVCKAGVDKLSVIPIYGRGRAENTDPRDREEELPPRPSGRRQQPIAQGGYGRGVGFGTHHAAFGRINPYGANYENVSLSTFGLFPNLFGLQIAYPHVNEPVREEPPVNQEDDGMSDLVAKVFLLLSVFIAIIITTF